MIRAWMRGLGVLGVVVMSCSVEGGGGLREACDGALAQLRECGLATEGTFQCEQAQGGACGFECFRAAGCDELSALVCGDSDTPMPGTPLFECIEACKTFVCTDGERRYPSVECDGWAQCADGSDEMGCTNLFTCENGSTIVDTLRCNAVSDCSDGSDEEGCNGLPQCADGRVLSADQRCNGANNCGDGSDEAGCPPVVDFICPGA